MKTTDAILLGRRAGITPSALHVLLLLVEHPCLRPTDIAKRAEISTSAATGLIDVLEKNKWVVRTREDRDRRVIYVSITSKALKFFHDSL